MEIFVENDYRTMVVRVYIRERESSIDKYYFIDNGILSCQTVDRSNFQYPEVKPFMEMPSYFYDSFAKAFIEQLNRDGIKTENENLMQGKLKATELHLNDLRENFGIVLKKLVELS